MNAHNPIKTHVKERAEEQSSAMTQDQQAAIRMLANDLHRLNQAVMKAVEAGVSVELVRSARHHGGGGNWGIFLSPSSSRRGVTPPETTSFYAGRLLRPAYRSEWLLIRRVIRSATVLISRRWRSSLFMTIH